MGRYQAYLEEPAPPFFFPGFFSQKGGNFFSFSWCSLQEPQSPWRGHFTHLQGQAEPVSSVL
ncbi:hypothetical protein DXA14_04720 [Hungatella hathewayi]|nr:hypothetical protein DXA14_04720 [Hungatella hathewayi]RHB77146.1 hypothetical protein DW876_01475 [Hungatella hathewayi]